VLVRCSSGEFHAIEIQPIERVVEDLQSDELSQTSSPGGLLADHDGVFRASDPGVETVEADMTQAVVGVSVSDDPQYFVLATLVGRKPSAHVGCGVAGGEAPQGLGHDGVIFEFLELGEIAFLGTTQKDVFDDEFHCAISVVDQLKVQCRRQRPGLRSRRRRENQERRRPGFEQ
jgi:hypothetical protein